MIEAAYGKARTAIAEDLEDARARVAALEDIVAALDRLSGGGAAPVARKKVAARAAPVKRRKVAAKPAASPAPPAPRLDIDALQERVFQALKAAPKKARELAADLGCDELQLRYALQCLRKQGRIGVKGATASARWEQRN